MLQKERRKKIFGKMVRNNVIKVHGMKTEDVTPEFEESHKAYIKYS
jgi:hypothetical protein